MSNNDSTDTEQDSVPEFTDGAHIAGFEFAGQNRPVRNDSATRPEATPLTVDKGVAGVDEPDPSLREKDELDEWGGPKPEEQSDARFLSTEPVEQVAPEKSQDNDDGNSGLLQWLLPNQSDDGDHRRRGLFSTRPEVHAFVIGVAAGAGAAQAGEFDTALGAIGTLVAGDRLYKAKFIDAKYREQIKAELPYFVAGVAVGYGGSRYGPQLAALGV